LGRRWCGLILDAVFRPVQYAMHATVNFINIIRFI